MLVEIETRWKGRLKDTEEKEHGLASWRLKKFGDFYENKHKRKRMNDSDDNDETDSTKGEVSALMEKNSVLRIENAALEVEIKTLRELLSNSREVQNKSTLENSTLQFEKSSLKKDNIYLTKKVQGNKRVMDQLDVLNTSLSTQLISKKDIDYEQEVDKLQNEVKTLMQSKIYLHSIVLEKEDIIKEMKKDLKREETKNALKESYESELLSLQNKMKAIEVDNDRLIQNLQVKEMEIEKIKEHRDQIIKNYDNALIKEKEATDREKREVMRLNDVLYRRTPTPSKGNQKEMEIEKIYEHRDQIIKNYDNALIEEKEATDREKREVMRLNDILYRRTPTPSKGNQKKPNGRNNQKSTTLKDSNRENVAPVTPNIQSGNMRIPNQFAATVPKLRSRRKLNLPDDYDKELEPCEIPERQIRLDPEELSKRILRNRKIF